MNDKAFLMWIHDRLIFEHGENKNFDYMHKLRAIIKDTPDDKYTPNVCSNADILKTETAIDPYMQGSLYKASNIPSDIQCLNGLYLHKVMIKENQNLEDKQ